MSSTAFFIEAAANTVIDLSCAKADGEPIARTTAIAASRAFRGLNIYGAPSISNVLGRGQPCPAGPCIFSEATDPEAPFRSGGGRDGAPRVANHNLSSPAVGGKAVRMRSTLVGNTAGRPLIALGTCAKVVT